MKELEDRIRKDGKIKPGNILKVDSFLNHQVDITLYNKMGAEFARLFEGSEINKIITIEASGIGISCITAQYFGNVPVIYAKKSKSTNMSDSVYSASVYSFTHKTNYTVMVSKEFISPSDKILIIDDFLACGNALKGLIRIIEDAGATLSGVGIVIEKVFQEGGSALRSQGIRIESLAMIEDMSDDSLTFSSEV